LRRNRGHIRGVVKFLKPCKKLVEGKGPRVQIKKARKKGQWVKKGVDIF